MIDQPERTVDPQEDRADARGPSRERRTAEAFLSRRVRPWDYFGGLGVICVVIQALTGVLMAFSYQPTPDNAYTSVYYIANVMRYGWLVRTAHVWGAVLLVLFVATHVIHVFVIAAYKRHHPSKWVLGCVALLATLAAGFTGSLLPWDQKAYWSTEAAISLVREVPLIGMASARLMLGSETLGAAALTRFSTMHIVLLPALLAGLLVAHVRTTDRLRFLGASHPSATPAEEDSERTTPVYPDLFMSWATTIVLLLCVFAVLAILLPAALDVKADRTVTPETVKPMWYFFSLYALSRYLPSQVASTLPLALGIVFALMPVIDRSASRKPRDRALALTLGSCIIGAIMALTLAGVLL